MDVSIIGIDSPSRPIGPGPVLTFDNAPPLEVREVVLRRKEDFRFDSVVVGISVDDRWFLDKGGEYFEVFDTPNQLADYLWTQPRDPWVLVVLHSLGWLALDVVAIHGKAIQCARRQHRDEDPALARTASSKSR